MFIALIVVMGEAYYLRVVKNHQIGITTIITALLTYILGIMIYHELSYYVIILGIIIIVLLELKPRLESIEQHISKTDINAVILLDVCGFASFAGQNDWSIQNI